jgi:hypothetical protein
LIESIKSEGVHTCGERTFSLSSGSRPTKRESDPPQNYIIPDTDIICMPTKTVVEGKKATPKTPPKGTLTQAEIQASIDRLDADMERWGKGRRYTLAEVEKRLEL